jgi:hypothetical protein
MDEKSRRDDAQDGGGREAAHAEGADQGDELARRRENGREQHREFPALTRREREERWPLG